jgi:hypothetical protein
MAKTHFTVFTVITVIFSAFAEELWRNKPALAAPGIMAGESEGQSP